jgi:hypothetical protein
MQDAEYGSRPWPMALEVAGFYRSLAGIIPAMPTRCKINGATLPETRAERWKARAEESRTLADCFTDPFCRGQFALPPEGLAGGGPCQSGHF